MSGVGKITNLCATPYGTVQASYRWNTVPRKLDSGKYSYVIANPDANHQGTFSFLMGVNDLEVGDMLVCVFSCQSPNELIVPHGRNPRISGTNTTEGAVLTDTMGWVAGRIAQLQGNHELWMTTSVSPVTLEGCAAFRASDWPSVRKLLDSGDLPMAWFAPPCDATSGETRPPVLVP